jgi:cytochrome c2
MSDMSEFDEQSAGASIGIGLVIILFGTLAVIAIYATAVGTEPDWTSLEVAGGTWEGLADPASLTAYEVVDADAGKYRIPISEAMAAAAKDPNMLSPMSSASAVPVAEMTAAQHGEALFESLACTVCHSVDGSPKVGPSLKGVWGKEEKLVDGSTVLVDEAYIASSIRDPNAQVVEGFPPAMVLSSPVSDEQIVLLTAYIQSLAN